MSPIPIILMFNNNYVIPAAVALYSMLVNRKSNNYFDIRILHTDITSENIDVLHKTIESFPNASLTFYSMSDIDRRLNIPDTIADYPKEIIYKLIVADIFPDLDRAIITDADVVFEDDISDEFIKFNTDEYFAGVKQTSMSEHLPFSTDITDSNMHFVCGAGYMIYNLAKMRADDMPNKYMQFMRDNAKYLKLPDQEILNIVSWPNIKLLHPRNMVLVTYYASDDFVFDKNSYTSTYLEHEYAKAHPVQIHFVGYKTWGKPWNDFNAPCANLWYRYLTYTPCFTSFMKQITAPKTSMPMWCKILLKITPIKSWRKKMRKRYNN